MQLLAIFAENKPGQTADITGILAEAGVTIHWVTIANNGNFGVMKFLVDKPGPALHALRAKHLMVATVDVLAVEVPNRVGGLHQVARLLSSEGINLADCSGFVANNRAILLMEVPDLAQAQEVLERASLRVLTEAEVVRL